MGRVWVWMDVCLRGDRLVSRDESAANGGEFVVRVSPAHIYSNATSATADFGLFSIPNIPKNRSK